VVPTAKIRTVDLILRACTMDYWLITAPMGMLRPEAVFVGVPPAG
jgi:hypothetical protein